SGSTNINDGTLSAAATNVFPQLTSVSIAAGATLALRSFNQTIGSLSGGGAVALGNALLTAGGNGASSTFAGPITGSGNFTKASVDFSSGMLSHPNLVGMSVGAVGTVNYNGVITPAPGGFRLGGGGTLVVSGVNALSSSPNMTLTNGGTVAISASNNFTGKIN